MKASMTTAAAAAAGKDTEQSEAGSSDRNEGQRHPTTPAADLSSTLPSDEMVFGGKHTVTVMLVSQQPPRKLQTLEARMLRVSAGAVH